MYQPNERSSMEITEELTQIDGRWVSIPISGSNVKTPYDARELPEFMPATNEDVLPGNSPQRSVVQEFWYPRLYAPDFRQVRRETSLFDSAGNPIALSAWQPHQYFILNFGGTRIAVPGDVITSTVVAGVNQWRTNY